MDMIALKPSIEMGANKIQCENMHFHRNIHRKEFHLREANIFIFKFISRLLSLLLFY